jgi:adenosine deaminase
MKLPVNDYHEFVKLVTADPDKIDNLQDYIQIFEDTDRIQSSPLAVERSVYEVIGGAYRKGNVDLIEVRFNPMKRNNKGEKDLDQIILSAAVGMKRACLEYKVKAGLILCLAREFTVDQNSIIAEKAVKYKNMGVVGIDIAGDESIDIETGEDWDKYWNWCFGYAHTHKLGVTYHIGETPNIDPRRVLRAVEMVKPNRIGHGIQIVNEGDDWGEVARAVKRQGIILELCPTSNVKTKAVENWGDLGNRIQRLMKLGIPFTINTDGPSMLETTVKKECDTLVKMGVLTPTDIEACMLIARRNTFVKY